MSGCELGAPGSSELITPQPLATMLLDAVDHYGVDSAVARYETLRADMVSERYDFSEASLSDIANTLAERGKTAEAITLLELNQRYDPNSANIDFALGELHRQRGERDQAITESRMVLQKRPNDRRALQRLREMGAGTSN